MSDQEDPPALRALNDLGHLSSAVGHNVINAFSAIVSNAEILRIKMAMTTPVDPAVLADTIIHTAIEASTVARRLIDYTRPITTIGEETLTLDRLVAGYVESASQNAPGGVTWTTDLAEVPPIKGHVTQLRGMLGLLATNAFEAMGGREITLSLATSVDTRGWVCLEIRDTGTGMGDEAREHAVEPFFTTKPGHIGVGLSIANGIWRRHRGTLQVQSVERVGTTLRLCVEPSSAY